MKRESFLLALVILLVVLNAAVLVFLIPRMGARPEREGRPTHEIMIETLGLDSAQQRQFALMREETHLALDRIDARFDGAVSDYFALLTRDEVSASAKDSLEQAILGVQREKANCLYDHFLKVKSICREDQKSKFVELLPELTHLIHPPPNNRPAPAPRGN